MIYIHQSYKLLPVAACSEHQLSTTLFLHHFGSDILFEILTNYFQKFLQMMYRVHHQALRSFLGMTYRVHHQTLQWLISTLYLLLIAMLVHSFLYKFYLVSSKFC